MPVPERLGGFKVLKNVARITIFSARGAEDFPLRVFRIIADRKINLLYATCISDGDAWILVLVMEPDHALEILMALEAFLAVHPTLYHGCAVLSIFPHRKNPEIAGALFEAFGREGIPLDALASSPSTISVVLNQGILNRAGRALFGPFTFGAYRTPADWKLAQKGKEQLYKEVVASYQEKRPKVYGLQYHDGQALLRVHVDRGLVTAMGPLFNRLALPGLSIPFLMAGPGGHADREQIAFCVPVSELDPCREALREAAPFAEFTSTAPAALFSMNGPHFGDRYGIASALLAAFETDHVSLVGLSCTIASITGVISSSQLGTAIEAIQSRFDIP